MICFTNFLFKILQFNNILLVNIESKNIVISFLVDFNI